MKSTFKKLILAATLLLPLAFTSCGSDSDDEPEQITVTKSEIQGEWFNMSGGYYRRLEFDGSNYSYYIKDLDTRDYETEAGTYTLNGTKIHFEPSRGKSIVGTGNCEIYWQSEAKKVLYIWPIGGFLPGEP